MHPVSPDQLLQVLSGHMTAKYLYVANELNVFEVLTDKGETLSGLSEKTKVPERTLRIVLDALVATGFLLFKEGCYENSAVTATYLSGKSPSDFRPILRLWNKVVYPQLATMEEAIRTNKRTYGLNEFSEQEHEIFNRGVATLTAPSARALAGAYEFERHVSVLDVAGGLGFFLTAVMEQHSNLKGTLFELPATAMAAQKRLIATGAAERITILEGDVLKDKIPTGHDVVILANIIHLFSPHSNALLLRRIREAVPEGARLLLVDFWTNATHTQPVFAALLAVDFHIFTGEGDVYSVEEMGDLLANNHWRLLKHQPLTGAASLIVAEAI